MNSTKSRISIGDKVALNSGGPEMLVVDIEWGKIVCSYKANGKLYEESFRSACLTNKS